MKKNFTKTFLVLFSFLVFNQMVRAGVELLRTDSTTISNGAPSNSSEDTSMWVISVHSSLPDKNKAGLGNYIFVEVRNLKQLLAQSKEKDQKIMLYFDEIPMSGIYAEFENVNEKFLKFRLSRWTADEKSIAVWKYFFRFKRDYSKKVNVSVGFEKGGSIPSDANGFELILLGKNVYRWLWGSFLLMFALFLWLAWKTQIIKDESSSEKAPYSLARTQLALWTFIVVFSYCYIWIMTGEQAVLTGSTLILLSISIGTAASAKMIEASQEGMVKIQNNTSDGFLQDILSDEKGVNIHRFQMLIWTIVLSIIFVNSVFQNLAMPQFDDSLLTLMGISNGTYLGLKIPENKTAK